MRMKARIHVSLKPGVLEPQGKAIGNALKGLGFAGGGDVRQGKLIEFELTDTDPALARARVEEMCRQLLANPVIENYAIEIDCTDAMSLRAQRSNLAGNMLRLRGCVVA